MKYDVSLLVLGLAVGVMPVALADPKDSVYYAPTETADTATTTDTAETETQSQDDMAAMEKEAEEAEKALTPEQKQALKEREEACKKANDSSADVKEQMAAQEKCGAVTVNTKAPVSVAMGADARMQEDYNPPQNLLVGPKGQKQEISWAKYESFRQIGEARGFTDEAIAGIAGRLQVESGMFSPNKSGSMAAGDYMNGQYTSVGAAQWHKDRGTDLVNYINEQRTTRGIANNTSYPDASLAITGKTAVGLKFSANDQYNFVFEELPSQMKSVNYNALKGATDVGEAARIFTVYYERPANQGGQIFGRAGGTQTFYNASDLFNAGKNAYIADTSEWGSKNLTQYPSVGTVGSIGGTGGLGSTVEQLFGGNSGVGGIVQNILGQTGLLGGNNQLGGILNLLSGQGGTGDIKQLMAALLVQQLSKVFSGGGDSDDEDDSASSSDSGSSSTKDAVVMASALAKLKAVCGGKLPAKSAEASRASIMLMIRSCQS